MIWQAVALGAAVAVGFILGGFVGLAAGGKARKKLSPPCAYGMTLTPTAREVSREISAFSP